MTVRKTVDVTAVRDYANGALATKNTREFRLGVMFMLENVLHSTGNYKGFRYLSEDQVPVGELPGIRYYGMNNEPAFDNTDSTRVFYY